MTKLLKANAKGTEPASQEGFATIGEAAAFLAVSRSTVYTLMDHGGLTYAKFGKCRRIPWKALHEYAERSLVTK